MVSWEEFDKIEIRVGTILRADDFPKAKIPAYQLLVDFGERGEMRSSAQITKHYNKNDLIGRQIIAVVNFHPKQIANYISECLILGVVFDNKDDVILLRPETPIKNGTRVK